MPGSTTPDGVPYVLPSDPVADYPATSQALAQKVQAFHSAQVNKVPEPVRLLSSASNAVAATSWAALPTPVVVNVPALPVGTILLVHFHAWLIATGGSGDVRVALEASGGVSLAAGNPVGHTLYQTVGGGGAQSMILPLVVAQAVPTALQLKAQQAGGNTRAANYPGILAWAIPEPYAS